jgi:hypothetical protein
MAKLTNYIPYYLQNPYSIKLDILSSTRITFTIIDIGTLNPLEANRTYYKTLVSKFGCHKVSSADRKSQICMINVLSTFKKLEKLLNLFTDQDYQISFAVLA